MRRESDKDHEKDCETPAHSLDRSAIQGKEKMTTSNALMEPIQESKEDVLNTVLKSDSLPSLPSVASRLVTLTSQEDTTLSDVADLISQDIGMSTKILKL